ncbi:ATP-binding cassette subfamily B protein/subfamily B ATP-binding cassette protein MsbA [Paenibacillus endophyticus]|uniref:ATP-binding cassette subfamily B protein/subfamily B ATP-binding cassette protein MsbA n=1 Tax=Paenibacillus endophyticus TaxID=1294268 RepID=A0A7W5CCZ3_9BACL|nr:ABC transporter ATP-binding protein [Paenibacillus endophyticus]MBB3155461.1 ATP-binding cassette subfamily B protein/subfamily B ATP-binding cassette protein MsbA [Paenibacillus endophyticus]
MPKTEKQSEAARQANERSNRTRKQQDKQKQKAELDESGRSYVWALRFLLPYKKQIAALAACGTMAVAGETLTPKMIQYMIDHVVPNKDKSLFLIILAALTAVNLLMLVAKNYRNLLQRTIGELASRDMQTAIFKHLRRLGFAHYEQHPAGETLSMFNSEVASVQKIYRNVLPSVIDNLLFIMVAIVLLFSISGWLCLIMLPTFGLYYLFGPYFERKAALYGRQSGQGRIDYNQAVYESISGLREFRAFGSQPWYHERTLGKHKNWSRDYLLAATFSFGRGSFRRFTFYLGAIALFIAGYYSVQNQWITLGGFIAFTLLYMTTMFRLTLLVTQLTEQKLIIHQTIPLFRFMHKQIDIDDPADPVTLAEVRGGLVFEDICFQYPEQPPVINGFSLTIHPGEKVAFVGASGNGKTTMFKMIGRFYDPTSGVIKLDGVPIRQLTLERLRESIGYVFQETYLFGSSVKENIRFGKPEASDEEVVAAAKAAYAHDFIMQLPEGYDTLVGERGMKLSGGQKQRIAIARMFVKQPAIVLLDEATSSLDNVSEYEVQRALDEMLKGRTTIAIAHRLSTVKHFDRIVVIHKGRVAEAGSYEELIARQGLLYELEMGQLEATEGRAVHEVS